MNAILILDTEWNGEGSVFRLWNDQGLLQLNAYNSGDYREIEFYLTPAEAKTIGEAMVNWAEVLEGNAA